MREPTFISAKTINGKKKLITEIHIVEKVK